MTTPINHHVIVTNRFGIAITAPVVYIKDLSSGKVEVHIETNYHVEAGHDYPATYATPSSEAKGRYRVHGSEFTERTTYVYKGTFTRN